MLSTFDTKLVQKEFKKYVQKHGTNTVLLLKRDPIYRNIYIILPSVGFLIIASIFIITGIINDIDYSIYWYIKIGFFCCMFLVFLYKISDKILNYYLDFTIITPQEIVQYDQIGFFSRPMKTVAADKIKTITIRKGGIIQSIFNFGTLIFLSEGDEQGHGDIEIFFVHKPEEKKEKIREILKQL